MSQPNQEFKGIAWLDADTPVVQLFSTATVAPSGAVCVANVNGSGSTKLGDGMFWALWPDTQR